MRLRRAIAAPAPPAAPRAALRSRNTARNTARAALAMLGLVAAFYFLASIRWPGFNWWDDMTTYLVFVKRILQTGTILEPFNWRRLSTYGGQQVLQAPVVMMGGPLAAHIIDMGLSNVLTLGLTAGLVRGRSVRVQLALMAVVALICVVPMPRVNTQSQNSTVALLLGLFATTRLQDGRRWPLAILAGLLAAGLGSFRMNVLPAAALVLVLAHVDAAWRAARGLASPARRSVWARHAALATVGLATMGAALLPYALVLYESSGSLAFPLMQGTHRQEYQLTAMALPLPAHVWHTLRFFLAPQVLALLAPAALMALSRPARRVWPLYAASVLATAATVWAFTRSDTPNSIRLSFHLLYAPALASLALWLGTARSPGRWALGVGLLLACVAPSLDVSALRLGQMAEAIDAGLTRQQLLATPALFQAYEQAQQAVPPGQAFAAATTTPLLFDYHRNPIYNLDSPGTASLPPGMPLGRGPDALRSYLLGQHIEYLVAVDFDHDLSFYSRKYWQEVAAHPDRATPMDQASAGPSLAFFDLVDALARTDEVLYRSPILRVIRLRPMPSTVQSARSRPAP